MDTEVRAPASGLARLSLRLADVIAGVTLISAVLGIVAALLGLDALGSGPGGLWGLPMMALTLCALAGLLLGGAGVMRSRASGEHWRALVILAGPVLLVIAFFEGVHAVDPCASGLWDLESSLGGAPLCEPWGTGTAINVHARFHLLLHGIPAAALALLLRRTVRHGLT